MTYTFANQTFATIAAWAQAFPVYRSYPELFKAGASTVMEMEKGIRALQDKRRAGTLKGARKSALAAKYHHWDKSRAEG